MVSQNRQPAATPDRAAAPAATQIIKAGSSFKEYFNVEISAAAPSAPVEGVEIGKVAEYNGQPLFNVDLEAFEDKPWRKPGTPNSRGSTDGRCGCHRLFQLWI
jgi:hypothetical protein